MTESGFLGSALADKGLGAPAVLRSGNLEGAFVSGMTVPVLGAGSPVGSAGTKGYTQASFLSFFWEALGFEGWVRVWGFGLDHRLVDFMLQGLASFLLTVTQYQAQFDGEGVFSSQSFSLKL